jgi:hypothetical protein
MCGDKSDYDLGREIERAWLIRGEYDKVFEARAMGTLLFGGILLVCFFLGLLIHSF